MEIYQGYLFVSHGVWFCCCTDAGAAEEETAYRSAEWSKRTGLMSVLLIYWKKPAVASSYI